MLIIILISTILYKLLEDAFKKIYFREKERKYKLKISPKYDEDLLPSSFSNNSAT